MPQKRSDQDLANIPPTATINHRRTHPRLRNQGIQFIWKFLYIKQKTREERRRVSGMELQKPIKNEGKDQVF